MLFRSYIVEYNENLKGGEFVRYSVI